MANQGKQLGNLPFDDEVCNNIENQHNEQETNDSVKEEAWNEENEACDEPFAIVGVRASEQLMKMNTVEALLNRLGMDKK